MPVLYEPGKPRSNAVWVFAALILFLVCGSAVFAWLSYRAGRAAGLRAAAPQPVSADERRLAQLEEELYRLTDAMIGFERMQNRPKYLEALEVASVKNLEADAIWEKSQAAKRGLIDGLEGGFFEVWEQRFSPHQKFEMLSEKYSVPEEKVKKMKSDIEIMFAEELSEKFSHR